MGYTLWKEMDLNDAQLLMDLTWRLRNQEKVKNEIEKAEGDRILEKYISQNQNQATQFTTPEGTTKTVDLNKFSFD